MKIDFKRELEQASKSMIMVHDPKLLIKLIVRTIVQKLHLKHAAVIVYDPEKSSYVLDISRGQAGMKVPAGFARFSQESPLINLFTQKEFNSLMLNRSAILTDDISRLIWKESVVPKEDCYGHNAMDLLYKIDEQMRTLNTVACVPAYYQRKLMAILLLGEKKEGSKFLQEELDFFAALASDAAMAIRNAQLFTSLKKEARRNRELFIQTIVVLGSAIEAKDAYTRGHTERVTKYTLAIARQMVTNGSTDFSENFFENLYIAGMLHDIGKIGVKEAILNKEGKLSPAEYEEMKSHTILGAQMVQPLNLPKECLDGIRYHHENFDGSGYPQGLKGAEIPISASIVAVADAFDAITTDRPYRKGRLKHEAVEVIVQASGRQFNPIVVKGLVELFEAGKI